MAADAGMACTKRSLASAPSTWAMWKGASGRPLREPGIAGQCSSLGQRTSRPQQIFPLYQRLIALRLGHPSLRSDQIYPAAWPEWQDQLNPQGYGIDVGRQLAIFHRWGTAPGGGLECFIVVLNFSGQDQWVDIPFPCDGLWSDVLAAPLRPPR